uniref:Guanine nucleotide-binding protein subunit beta-like protein n=1 Tax=Eutreptiella gymnastica TaxID=73025 RepID=A0A7S1I6L1_9EUGL|mmetsp:Transcript_133947/g.232500  ORF Transcript_133947/g.232500 Transcript_133947/m.232500 type:complete len:417 (+) Transcript_133947:112-1362(+)
MSYDHTESDCLTAYTGLDPVVSLEVLSDCFLYGSYSGLIKGFNLQTGAHLMDLQGHTRTVKCMAASEPLSPEANPETLYSCSADGTIRIWDLGTGKCRGICTGHQGSVETVEYCDEEGQAHPLLFSGGEDGTVRVWNANTGDCEHTVKAHIGKVNALQRVGGIVYTCSMDGLAKAIDIEKGQLVAVYEGTSPIRCLRHHTQAATEEGQEDTHVLALGCADGRIRIYDTRTANCINTLEGHTEVVYTLNFADGFLYSTSDDGNIKHWNLESPKAEYTYNGHTDAIPCIRILPNGTFYTGSYDKSVRVWDREGVLEKLRIQRLLDDTGYVSKFNFAAKAGAGLVNRGGATTPSKSSSKGSKKGGKSAKGSKTPTKAGSRPNSAATDKTARTVKGKDQLEKETEAFAEGVCVPRGSRGG